MALCRAALVLLMTSACSRASGEDPPPAAPPPVEQPDTTVPAPTPARDAAAVVFLLPDGGERRVEVEVARTARQIQRGLMYREHLPPDAGMLFLFRREKVQSFWMKNTLIPLDMIFVSSSMDVVGVVENAEPKTLTSRKVPRPSLYVIEVNGGWARKNGVATGARVRFENVPPLTAADGPYD